MSDILLRAIFAENLALSFFLGMCTFLAVSQRLETAIGLGITMAAVQALTVPLNNVIYTHLLEPGAWVWAGQPELDLRFLALLVFIGLVAAAVQVVEMLLDRFFPWLHRALGIYLPLLTVNCAILGGSLFMVERRYDLGESAIFGLGTGIGWAMAIIALSAIRERLAYNDIPPALRGIGMAFIVTGFMSMAFSVFAGGAAP